jgi:hypothetical protein
MFAKIDRLCCSLAVTLILGCSLATAQAAPRQFSHRLTGSNSFESLIGKAEMLAQETANQAFRDANTTEIIINISGEQAGQIAPILFLSITRENWQRQPSIQLWAKYPGGVKRLLGFDRPVSWEQPMAIVTKASNTASNQIRDGMTEREANFYR